MLLTEVEQLRQQQVAVSDVVKSDAASFARSVADQEPTRFADEMRDVSRDLVSAYAPVSGEAAALFYETQRPDPGGRVEIAPPSIGDVLMSNLGWAFVPVFTPDGFPDPLAAVAERVGSVVARSVLQSGRDTMLLSAGSDPSSGGVSRYARANACAFCRLLSVSDADVSRDTVWHRNCHCVTVPYWDDNPLPTDPKMEGWRRAASASREELLRLQRELKPAGMRRRNFFKERPDLAVNNRNVARLMRLRLGISH